MKALKLISSVALLAGLCACQSAPTQSKWTPEAVGKTTLPTIEAIDNAVPAQKNKIDDTVAFGAKPYRWWEPYAPRAETKEGEPYLVATQTMRIVLAPYIDVMGDYHKRSEVIAVMKPSEWWAEPPSAVSESKSKPHSDDDTPPPPPPPPPSN
jgi:hypothetical protein